MMKNTNENKTKRKKKVAVFASGEGSTLQALIDYQSPHWEVGIVVVNKDCNAILRAQKAGIAALLSRDWDEIAQALKENEIAYIVLAGFLAIVPAAFCAQWEGKIINTHPSLLPQYGGKGMYGMKVHEAVFAAQERETGCTIHFVSAAIDGGAIICQGRVQIDPTDTPQTICARVQALERTLLPHTLDQLIENNTSTAKLQR